MAASKILSLSMRKLGEGVQRPRVSTAALNSVLAKTGKEGAQPLHSFVLLSLSELNPLYTVAYKLCLPTTAHLKVSLATERQQTRPLISL